MGRPWTLRARWLFPVAGPPISGGCVTILDDRVVEVSSTPRAPIKFDMEDVAIVPGLVNAHTHLEFSDLSTPIGSPGMALPTWLDAVITHRRGHASDPMLAVRRGIAESMAAGTVAVGEIAQPGWSAAPFRESGLNATIFLELIGLAADRAEGALALADQHVASSGASAAKAPWFRGLSPHAPYSVHWDIIKYAARLGEQGVPIAMHLAESREEVAFLANRTGPFREFLEQLGVYREDAFPEPRTIRDYLQAFQGPGRLLVVHGNYLAEEDIQFLAEQQGKVCVVYCPRTHAYFGHAPHPLPRLLARGIPVALGTDSRASNPDLSLFEEFRFAARRHPAVAPRDLLAAATRGGANALGFGNRLGTIEAGTDASLAIIRVPTDRTDEPHELLLDDQATPVATVLRGTPVVDAGNRLSRGEGASQSG